MNFQQKVPKAGYIVIDMRKWCPVPNGLAKTHTKKRDPSNMARGTLCWNAQCNQLHAPINMHHCC